MNLGLFLTLVIVVLIPIAWLVSEFFSSLGLRITLGLLAILCSFGVASVIGMLSELNYNAWYGAATKDLIDTTVAEIEDGELDRVMTVLRSVSRQYQPTYEDTPAKYRSLVAEAAARMRGDTEIEKGSEWDAAVFEHSTWLGHWEADSGFWIVIEDALLSYNIVRSGDPGTSINPVILSDNCQVLIFYENSKWKHTLTLLNRYEVEHEWFDIEENTVWQTDRLYKMKRASKAGKKNGQDTVK